MIAQKNKYSRDSLGLLGRVISPKKPTRGATAHFGEVYWYFVLKYLKYISNIRVRTKVFTIAKH